MSKPEQKLPEVPMIRGGALVTWANTYSVTIQSIGAGVGLLLNLAPDAARALAARLIADADRSEALRGDTTDRHREALIRRMERGEKD